MPLQLLDYQVARAVLPPTPSPAATEWDSAVVPNGQTWRVDQITVGMLAGVNVNNPAPAPLTVALYDVAGPGPTAIPIQATSMSLIEQNVPFPFSGIGLATSVSLFGDFDDQGSPITLLGGAQLAIVWPYNEWALAYLVRVQYRDLSRQRGAPQPAAGIVPGPNIPVSL